MNCNHKDINIKALISLMTGSSATLLHVSITWKNRVPRGPFSSGATQIGSGKSLHCLNRVGAIELILIVGYLGLIMIELSSHHIIMIFGSIDVISLRRHIILGANRAVELFIQ